MENEDMQLRSTDIATAVEYYGETELLDYIGTDRIEQYLALSQEDGGTDHAEELWAKVHLHQDMASAKVQLGDKYKLTIQADFKDHDINEVIIDIRMDRIFGVFLHQRNPGVA